jgi:hypothetical protein
LGAALAVLNHLEDSLAIRCLQANVRVAAARIEEREIRGKFLFQKQIGAPSTAMS